MDIGNMTTFFNIMEIIWLEYRLSEALVGIAESSLQTKDYNTVLYMSYEHRTAGDFSENANLKELGARMGIPVLLMSNDTVFTLKYNNNRNLLTIVQLGHDAETDRHLLRHTFEVLKENTQSRIILLVDLEDVEDEYVASLLEMCAANNAMNTIALLDTVLDTQSYYGLEIFPRLQVVVRSLEPLGQEYFAPHVVNMHQYAVSVIVDQVEPKTYFMPDGHGGMLLSGYVGKLFMEFARKHNATLTYPLLEQLGPNLFMDITDAMVENSTFNFSTGLTVPYKENITYTHIYDYLDWCIMLPVEKPLPSYMFYVIIFDYITLSFMMGTGVILSFSLALSRWLQGRRQSIFAFIVSLQVFAGLLGHSYSMHRGYEGARSYIYMIVSLAGIIFNTTYISYLQSFKTQAPREAPMESLDDMMEAGMTLGMYKDEMLVFQMVDVYRKYLPMIHSFQKYSEYFKMRDSFDTRYAYPVPSAKWNSYKEQQKFFSTPVFRISNICIMKNVGMVLPLTENSIFLDALNTLIGQITQSGIVEFWKSLSFLELVQIGRIRMMDLSEKEEFVPMKLNDMLLILAVYGSVAGVTFFVFLIELYWPHRSRFSKFVWRKLRIFTKLTPRS